MSIFSRIYRPKPRIQSEVSAHLGRFTDAYKEKDRYSDWDEALALFEQERYTDSFIKFFGYLRDEAQDNVKLWQVEEGLAFSFLQGSKEIVGLANEESLQAVAKIVRTDQKDIRILRRLINQNVTLNYSRFCLDADGDIAITFDTYAIDASPYKLYYALKEISLAADKQDDLLIEEFENIERIQSQHIEVLPEIEVETKLAYYQSAIQQLYTFVDESVYLIQKHPGALTYKLMDTAYRLDYLVRPEGPSMDILERINRYFFSSEHTKVDQKNQLILKEFNKLKGRSTEELKMELYRTYATFGITNPCAHERVVSFIDGELKNLSWYVSNGHTDIGLAGYGFIVGFILFNYAVPKPDHDFLHLYYEISQADFFSKLGLKSTYTVEGKLKRRAIMRALHAIVAKHDHEYAELRVMGNQLNFDNLLSFSDSYLRMICNLNMIKSR